MDSQQKLQRLLRLILMLSGPRKFQRHEIAERLGIEERTVYRYLNTLEDVGLVLERKGGCKLITNYGPGKDLGQIFHFTEEEMFLMHRLLEETEAKTAANEKLIKKLHALYDFKILKRLHGKSELDHIDVLKNAIQNGKQVLLREYRSSHSQNIRDRKVEPFAFMHDYKGIWCFDVEDQQNKQFHLSRIKEVIVTENNWLYKKKHQIPFIDAFRMSAEKSIGIVQLQMTLKAYNLLKDEYPLAIKFIEPSAERGSYILRIPVAAFEGIGRFIMGLPGEIEVLQPQELKDYLKEKQKILNQMTVVDSRKGEISSVKR